MLLLSQTRKLSNWTITPAQHWIHEAAPLEVLAMLTPEARAQAHVEAHAI